MDDQEKLFLDYFPALRDKADKETTPDYLNYISDTIEKSHNTFLKEQSPYYKIFTIFSTKKPLGLDDIQDIFNEVNKLKQN